MQVLKTLKLRKRFRPQQGLLIMNSSWTCFLVRKQLISCFRPQQGLLIMNLLNAAIANGYFEFPFPSPTGVTHYELHQFLRFLWEESLWWFPSPTGVTYYEFCILIHKPFLFSSFRPQQGLLIMNRIEVEFTKVENEFPSPTGVTYYESVEENTDTEKLEPFPSPTGVTYYE